MLDQIIEAGRNLFTDLLNEALENPAYILFGIGFILLSIFLGMLTRKDRKANPGKHPHDATLPSQDYSMGTVVINGQSHSVTRAGNTTYID